MREPPDLSERRSAKQELFAKIEAPAILKEDAGVVIKPCALCGARNGKRLYMQPHFPVVRCRECSLVYADEHFKEEELKEFYTGDYYQRAYVCHPAEIDKKIAADYVRAFDLVDRELKNGRVLDFGSARGTFIEELRRRGYEDRWELAGLDINADEVKMGVDRGLPIQCDTLETAQFPPGHFDAVTAFSVIEHLQDPLGTLREIHEVVRPGGELLIIVPSGSCLIIDTAVLASRVLGRRVRGFTDNVFHEEHLYYFTKKTMRAALEKTGYTPRKFFYQPSYLETHPPGFFVGAGAYGLRFMSWVLRRQTMLGVVATRNS